MAEYSAPWLSYKSRRGHTDISRGVQVVNMKLLMILALTLVLVNARSSKNGIDCDFVRCPPTVHHTCAMNSHGILQLFLNACHMHDTNCRKHEDFKEVEKRRCAGMQIHRPERT